MLKKCPRIFARYSSSRQKAGIVRTKRRRIGVTMSDEQKMTEITPLTENLRHKFAAEEGLVW